MVLFPKKHGNVGQVFAFLIIEGKRGASCQKAWERINAEIHFVAARFH